MNDSKIINFPKQLSIIKDDSSVNINALGRLESLLLYNEKSIPVPSDKNIHIIQISTILCIKSDSSYSTLYLSCGKKIVTSRTLKYWNDKIDDSHFLRCHNSYVINSKYVKSINVHENHILVDTMNIPMSRSKRSEIIDFF